jgi:phosphinothricin acetyltransferase
MSDLSAVVSINEQGVAAGVTDSGFLILPLHEQQVLDDIASGEVEYAVCETAGTLTGFLKHSCRTLNEYQDLYWYDTPVDLLRGVHIEKVAVREGFRGQGVGRALYEHLVTVFPAKRLYSFVVTSPCANSASLRFHEALGFKRRGHAPYAMPDGSWFLDCLHVLENE